jgi:hypothetical protein
MLREERRGLAEGGRHLAASMKKLVG